MYVGTIQVFCSIVTLSYTLVFETAEFLRHNTRQTLGLKELSVTENLTDHILRSSANNANSFAITLLVFGNCWKRITIFF